MKKKKEGDYCKLENLQDNKVLRWHNTALICRDQHLRIKYTEKQLRDRLEKVQEEEKDLYLKLLMQGKNPEACKSCPIIKAVGPRSGDPKELSPETCQMYNIAVLPLTLAEIPVEEKMQNLYDYYIKTGTTDI